MGDGDGGDERVVGADGQPSALQVGANTTIGVGAAVVERQRDEWGKEVIEQTQVFGRPVATVRAVDEFGFDDRAKGDVGRAVALQVLGDLRVPG